MALTYFRCGRCQATTQCDCERKASEVRDPWVVVGTTTIDGTLEQVKRCMEDSDPERDAESVIDEFVRAGEPWLVGGRHLRARGSHINGSRGTALIRCDIVRRQSEIDAESFAETMRSVAPAINELAATMRAMDPCPECGPHGNAGEVLLASTWAKCTTCNGGKMGDLWGEVQAESSGATSPAVESAAPAPNDFEVEALSLGRSLRPLEYA